MASGSRKIRNENLSFDESYKKYLKQVKQSEGFDVEEFPALEDFMGIVVPVPNVPYARKHLAVFAEKSIEHFNELNGTAYELVKVLKATHNASRGIECRITFDAKEKDEDTKTFQVNLIHLAGDFTFKLIRFKPPPNKKKPMLVSMGRGWRLRAI